MKRANAYEGLGDVLDAEFDDMMKKGCRLEMVAMDDILVAEQIRDEFEDEENTADEMQASIDRHGVLQTVLLRPISGPKPYKLVAGERRYRGNRAAGEPIIPAMIKEMTDEEASDIQLAENIQRKNLTQIEAAKKIRKDLNELGTVELVMEKHSKGRAWVSKVLGLLSLTPQAKRLVNERISADLEVIGQVKTIEKIDPVAAKALVEDLKKTRGKEDARKKTLAVKDTVKPKTIKPEKGGKGVPATAKDVKHVTPGRAAVTTFADAKKPDEEEKKTWPFPEGEAATQGAAARPAPPLLPPSQVLTNAFSLIFQDGANPKVFMETLAPDDRANVKGWLQSFYDAGRNSKNLSKALIQGLRDGTFATDGAGAFAMLAFIQGGDAQVDRFNVVDVLGLVKAQ